MSLVHIHVMARMGPCGIRVGVGVRDQGRAGDRGYGWDFRVRGDLYAFPMIASSMFTSVRYTKKMNDKK